ncbi:uncharacterized protein ATNIH1004_001590 [Aspergillus tanneri]|uniref:ERCC4 domain-containing protein n=1 Tax=Aspergillus tanneri TaxID=1220188 RepID=A0A5M9N003_9EURO|nr:uncharacterized protein ATNIH1004_001590 [Aspergillus tanneri]KAA8652685.1 hypothetical protein ATNIH1004_001590 [Aspergillus tanneri]
MPDVIDLLSSTPPCPRDPPPPPSTRSHFDIPLSIHDDEIENTSKRRRLSYQSIGASSQNPISKSALNSPVPASRNPLFLFSDEDILPSPSGGPTNARLSAWNGGDSDPVVFTSSAPETVRRGGVTETRTEAITITIDDDDDDDDSANHVYAERRKRDEIEGFSDELVKPDLNGILAMSSRSFEDCSKNDNDRTGLNFSSRTANLLASLESRSNSKSSGRSKPQSTTSRTQYDRDVVDVEEDILDEIAKPRNTIRKKTTTARFMSAEKEARAKEREATKAQRERDKLQEKERKQKLKEEKAREKQLAADIAQVNKLKVDKKESTPEMIVDLASSFEGTSVGNQTVEFMHKLGVELHFCTSEMANIVRWRRKVKARYNTTAGHWEPCPFHIRQEEQVLVFLTAQEFVDMVISSPSTSTDTAPANLDRHVQKLRTTYTDCKPIYLIEGLTGWMRKNQNSRNRAYVAEVRRQMDPEPASSQPSSRKRKPAANKPESSPPIDDDTIEDALLQLQVAHSCLIHHTNAAPETAEWIKNFTEHLSTAPYRQEMMDGRDAAFCMDTGQVKPGDTKSDTFIKMLQEVHRVTASMAYGIAVRYPSVVDLVQAIRLHGPSLLEDVKKSANRNGTLTESRIGPAASKRLYKVFMGVDSSSTDV